MTHARVMPVFRRENLFQKGTVHVHARVQHTRLENKYTALYTADTRPCTTRAQWREKATGEGHGQGTRPCVPCDLCAIFLFVQFEGFKVRIGSWPKHESCQIHIEVIVCQIWSKKNVI